MPRLQKPESTRVPANGDARTLLLRWVATRVASVEAPDVRPSHPNTVNLFFNDCEKSFSRDSQLRQRTVAGRYRNPLLPGSWPTAGFTCPHDTSEKSLATTWRLAAQTLATQESPGKVSGFAIKPVVCPNPQNQLCWQNTQTTPKFRFQVDQQVLICKC